MKILLATGYEELDQGIKKYIENNPQLDIEVVGEVYYRAALKYLSDDVKVVIISEQLPGDGDDFISTIYGLRKKGIRPIILPGAPEHPETQELVRRCTPLGVYDYVYNDVTIDAIVAKILKPSTIDDTGVDTEVLQEPLPEMPETEEVPPLKPKEVPTENQNEDVSPEDEYEGKIVAHVKEAMATEPVKRRTKSKSEPRPKSKPKSSVKRRKIRLHNPFANVNSTIKQVASNTKRTVSSILERKVGAGIGGGLGHDKNMVITVWSPTGTNWPYTALNLAIIAARKHKTALLNFDLSCPDLDGWFDIKTASTLDEFNEKDTGVLTFGQNITPELCGKMLKEKWGVKYLPVGNKLNNIGTPDYGEPAQAVTLFKGIIQLIKKQNQLTVIHAGRDYEYPPTYAAISEADLLLIPYTGSPYEENIITMQLKELERIEVVKPVIELLYCISETDKSTQIGQNRVQVYADYSGYIVAAQNGKPYALEEQEEWIKVLSQINRINC